MDVDHGELVGRGLDDVTIVMRLDELGPVDRRSSGGRERGRFEGFVDRLENLPDGRRVGDEGDEADVAAAGRALEWKLLADAGEELGPRDSGGVVGAGLARELADRMTWPNVLDYLPIDPEYSVAEVAMPGSLSGRTLAEANLRSSIGVHVMGIKDVMKGKFEMFPDGRTKLLDDQILLVVGREGEIAKLRELP